MSQEGSKRYLFAVLSHERTRIVAGNANVSVKLSSYRNPLVSLFAFIVKNGGLTEQRCERTSGVLYFLWTSKRIRFLQDDRCFGAEVLLCIRVSQRNQHRCVFVLVCVSVDFIPINCFVILFSL